MKSRFIPLIRKEFIHIRRDPRSLLILFIMPFMMMFIFGYAIDMDLKHIRVGICDLSKTPGSRDLIERLEASEYFKIVIRYDDPHQTESLFEKRLVRAAIIVPRDFVRDLEADGHAQIGVFADGTDANSATLVQNYTNALFMNHALSMATSGGGMPVELRVRMLYNPDMESAHFVVPGIVAILMIMVGALLTSITIAREKETGTMEQILVSPIKSYEIVLGKAVPYLILAFIIALLIIVFGMIWFNVPMLGAWPQLLLLLMVYLFTSIAIGLLISSIVSTQQVAMMLALVATLLPSMMLSGFIFPIASMPKVLQVVSNIVPATHFLKIIRGIMLKGNGLFELLPPIAALFAIGAFFIALAVKRFRLKLQ